jgi:hypothetical protein
VAQPRLGVAHDLPYALGDHVSISYLICRDKLTESVNLVNEKRVHGVIRNYSLPQEPFMNFLYHGE